MIFTSDNAHIVSPEILKAIAAANEGTVSSYGADQLTQRLGEVLGGLFGREVAAFPVMTGTAANALALATVTPSYGAIFCHAEAHVQSSEFGAPEFFSGAKLVTIEGADGRMTGQGLADMLELFPANDVHYVKPATVTITQSTEMGTLYRPAEISQIKAVADTRSLAFHMDGARFANAMAALDCSAAAITCDAGVDVLSFGATKNGAMAAEVVIFFDPRHAEEFAYRRKRGGHLVSKMRFVSAQLLAYLEDDLWLRNARHANAMATRLAEGLANLSGVTLIYAVEANEIFIRLPRRIIAALEALGAQFYDWPMSGDGPEVGTVRLVTSFATQAREVEQFLKCAAHIG